MKTRHLRYSASVVFAVASLCAARIEPGIAQDSKPRMTSDQIRDAVLLGNTANDERLGKVLVELEEVTEDLTVTEKTETTVSVDADTQIVSIQDPRKVRTAQAILSGANFKISFHNVEATGAPKEFSFDGDQWTEKRSDIRKKDNAEVEQLIIRRPDQMARMLPLDPRQLAVYDIRHPLSEVFDNSVFAQADPAASATPGSYTAEHTSDPGIHRLVITCDPSFGLLPVDSTAYFPDGSIFCRTQLKYQKVAARNAWLLDTAETRQYRKGAATSPDSTDHNMKWTTRITAVQLLDDKNSKDVKIGGAPDHFRVDLTKSPVEVVAVGRPNPSRPRESPGAKKSDSNTRTGLIVFNCLLALGLVVVWRLRSAKSA